MLSALNINLVPFKVSKVADSYCVGRRTLSLTASIQNLIMPMS